MTDINNKEVHTTGDIIDSTDPDLLIRHPDIPVAATAATDPVDVTLSGGAFSTQFLQRPDLEETTSFHIRQLVLWPE